MIGGEVGLTCAVVAANPGRRYAGPQTATNTKLVVARSKCDGGSILRLPTMTIRATEGVDFANRGVFEMLVETEGTKADGPAPQLSFLWLEVTNRCNLRCVHCYANSGPDEPVSRSMVHLDWMRVLQEAADLGCRNVQFIGGEPTLYPSLLELVDYANDELCFDRVEVYTNGTRVSKDDLLAFKKKNVRLAFSFYSSEPEQHMKVTGSRAAFFQTLRAIEGALVLNIPVRVGVIDVFEDRYIAGKAMKFLQELGVKNIGIDRVRQFGRGAKGEASVSQFHDLCGACSKGRLAVHSTGAVAPCVFSHFHQLGDARDGLRSILESKRRQSFCRALDRGEERPRMCGPIDKPCYPVNPPTPRPCGPEYERCGPDGCRPEDWDD